MTRVVTILEAYVSPDRQAALRDAYRAAVLDERPPGLVRSALLQSSADRTLWRIETVWESREALETMRGLGTPRGLLIFRAVGAEPRVQVFDAVDELTSHSDTA